MTLLQAANDIQVLNWTAGFLESHKLKGFYLFYPELLQANPTHSDFRKFEEHIHRDKLVFHLFLKIDSIKCLFQRILGAFPQSINKLKRNVEVPFLISFF